MTYDDHRLAALYDEDNPPGDDHDYFRALIDDRGAERIVDLGCGTGALTVTLARPGRQVIGIDPAAAMLAVARARPAGDHVEWRLGGSERIDDVSADMIIMTGNVVMHLVGEVWESTLADVAQGLVSGGTVAFESRNPQARAWRSWNQPLGQRRTAAGRLRESMTTTEPDPDGVVIMSCHNEFLDAGGVVDVEQRLQFRTADQICTDLARTGLAVSRISRDWGGRPFTGGPEQPLMIFEATRLPG